MWFLEKKFKIIIGGNTYIDVPDLVVYKGETLFTLKRHDRNGELGIYFELYEASGVHIASVKRNQIYPTGRQGELYRLHGSADEYVLLRTDTGQNVCQNPEEAHGPY
jgi:hypothetical protein